MNNDQPGLDDSLGSSMGAIRHTKKLISFLIDHPKLIEIYKCAPKLLAKQLTSVAWHTPFRSNDQPRQVFVFTSVWWKLRSSLALSWHVHRRADLALWRVLHGLHG